MLYLNIKEYYMKKNVFGIMALIVALLVMSLVLAGCDTGTNPDNGNNGNGKQSASVEATFTVEQFAGTKLYYRFDWPAFPGALYYNIYRLSTSGKPVKEEGYITDTTFADNETVTYHNTEGQYYWVTAVLPEGETKPPENKIIKFSWKFAVANPSYILEYKKVEYVPYSSIPLTP
jgi:hypothetical protein